MRGRRWQLSWTGRYQGKERFDHHAITTYLEFAAKEPRAEEGAIIAVDVERMHDGLVNAFGAPSPRHRTAVWRTVVRRIEAELAAANELPERVEIAFDESDVAEAGRLLGPKTCDFQHHDPFGLVCIVGNEARKHPAASTARQRVPVIESTCLSCPVADSDIRCAALTHLAVDVIGGPAIRAAMCAIGNTGAQDDPGACLIGGHTCAHRLIDVVAPSPPSSSPLTLPEAFDFLDVAWRLAFGRKARLLGRPAMTNIASLALDASTRADLADRLSALADVIGALQVPDTPGAEQPGDRGHTLERLRQFLSHHLDIEGSERAIAAVNELAAAVRVRAAMQHSGAAPDLPRKLAELGVDYPPIPSEAWDVIRQRVAGALATIRVEILTTVTD